MELLLNLFWLLIAAVLLCTWRTQWVHERRGGIRHRVQEWSAVSLALVLLFFAVSMSDDMHSEIVALEESSLSRRDQVVVSASAPLPRPGATLHAPLWATTLDGATSVRLENTSGTLEPELRSSPRVAAIDPRCSRSPPVSCSTR